MSNLKLPVNFEEKAKLPAGAGGTGYPYRISASDLMKNFAYAALDVEDGWTEDVSVGSHSGRKLKLPALPGGGTHVLGCVGGTLQWIENEEIELQYLKNNEPEVGIFFKKKQ
jgi:hypothetical protein